MSSSGATLDGPRPLCADVSRADAEPLGATASRVDHWILIEYKGLWSPDPLPGSTLSEAVKLHLRDQLGRLARAKLLFVRRPERRRNEGVRVFYGTSTEQEQHFAAVDLATYEQVVNLDLAGALRDGGEWPGETLEHPLLIVCTHGKHDRCCAKYGRPLYEALRDQADDDWVWQSSHLGGDRFAGNVVVLPEGLYFGRVDPSEAWAVLDEYLAGRIQLERYRGRACYGFAVQAAELAVREATGERSADGLAFLDRSPCGDGGQVVRFAADGGRELHEVTIASDLGEPSYLTCMSRELRRARRFVATSHRRSPAPAR